MYVDFKKDGFTARIPLKGSLDITYRCNNNCRHCWLRIPPSSQEANNELRTEEIKDIIDQARTMGTNQWLFSGGEPMLRPDFPEVFDYATRKCVSYSLNTNGSLINPEISHLLRRKGATMISLYGASSNVHDFITRNCGSFDATMRGIALLKKAGAQFIIQFVPMRSNYRELGKMIELAKSLGSRFRLGATWLYLSSVHDIKKNSEIIRQRLEPRLVVKVNELGKSSAKDNDEILGIPEARLEVNYPLLENCISSRKGFHIDPYGGMTFCCFIKDPSLRINIRGGDVKKCWEEQIPLLSDKVRCSREYMQNCGTCAFRGDCQACPVFGYLENRSYSARIGYLCEIARETAKSKAIWRRKHQLYFQVANLNIRVDSDSPLDDDVVDPKIKNIALIKPRLTDISIMHYPVLPAITSRQLGKRIFSRPPWTFYRKGNSLICREKSHGGNKEEPEQIVIFSHDYAKIRIYNKNGRLFQENSLRFLTFFPFAEFILAPVLAAREGCILSSLGVVFNEKGYIFIGDEDLKKRMRAILQKEISMILFSNTTIVRKVNKEFRIYNVGNEESPHKFYNVSASLASILFLEKSKRRQCYCVNNKNEIMNNLISWLIKPIITPPWWNDVPRILGLISKEIPCYSFSFGKGISAKELFYQVTT